MSQKALINLVSNIREFVNLQPEIKLEEIIRVCIVNKIYYLPNLTWPGLISKQLIESIVTLIFNNPTESNLSILDFATNVVVKAKKIEKAIQINNNNYFLIFQEMLIPIYLDLDNVGLLVNKKDVQVEDYNPKGKEIILVDFQQIDNLYNKYEIITKYNNTLIGRLYINNDQTEYISSSYTSFKENDQIFSMRLSLPSKYQSSIIMLLNEELEKLTYTSFNKLGLLTKTNMYKYHSLLDNNHIPYDINNFEHKSNESTYDILLQSGIKKVIQLPSYDNYSLFRNQVMIEACSHYNDITILTADMFEDKYIIYNDYASYCKICGEKITIFDNTINLIDKTFNRKFKIIVNLKIFDSHPYRDYSSCYTFVIDKNNQILFNLKISIQDYVNNICKNLIDLLLYHNYERTNLTKKYSQQIKINKLFFPRLTNQLFMLEIYEKEQFAEEKYINMTILYIMIMMFTIPNIIILLMNNDKSIFVKKNQFVMPSYSSLCATITIKAKLCDKSSMKDLEYLFELYLNDDILTPYLREVRDNFLHNYKRLDDDKFISITTKKEPILVTSYDEYPLVHEDNISNLTYNDRVSLTQISVNRIASLILSLTTNNIQYKSLHYQSIVEKVLPKPYTTIEEALKIVNQLLPKISYQYSYNNNSVQNFEVNNNQLRVTTIITTKTIDPFINQITIVGNKEYEELYHGFPLPSYKNVNSVMIDYAIIKLRDITTVRVDEEYLIDLVSNTSHPIECLNILFIEASKQIL